MNKKFFTLAAGLLLTSAFSANAAGIELAKSKKGEYVEIKVSGKNLQIGDKNELGKGTFPASVTTAKNLESAFDQQWQIASLKYDTNSGTPIYQFVNKGTGQYLAINLKTDNKGASKNVAKINAAGNKDWCYNKTEKHLYVFQNDSTYTLDNNLKLIAAKGNAVPSGAAEFTIEQHDGAVTLNADILNALMGKAGKLYFNGENVTDGETNVIADHTWKAYQEKTSASSSLGMVLAAQDKDSTEIKNPYVLVVDTAFYKGQTAYHSLKLDTLALDPAQVKSLKKNEWAYTVATYNTKKPAKFAHQAKAALWNGTYTLGNDSIALAVVGMPEKSTQKSVITDGTYNYGEADNLNSAISSVGWGLNPEWTAAYNATAGASGYTGTSAWDEVQALRTAFVAWGNQVGTSHAETANIKWKLADSKFAADGGAATGTNDKTYQELLDAAKAALDDAKDETNYAKELAFYEAAENMKSLERTPGGGDFFYSYGAKYTESLVEESSTIVPGTVTLAQLSNTKVLTVKAGITAENHQGTVMPLIQAVSTKGGDAEIDGNGKVYFMQVAAEPAEGSSLRATLKGKYLVDATTPDSKVFDKSNLVDEADANNVYAQWGFIEGATGYYQIVNRGTGDAVTLPINKTTKAGVYEINGEEIRLIEVDLSNADIREEKGVKYDYTGYYYGGPADGVSQSFQITPASALLSNVAVQFNKDSVLVLGKAENAPVWYLEGGDKTETWGAEIPGLPQLKRVKGYKIYTADAEGTKYYVYQNDEAAAAVYAITKGNSGIDASEFKFQTQAANAYLFLDGDNKATINLNLTVPTIEVSIASSERNDYFSFTKSEYSDYRTLVAEDGLLGNAKIYMENEPNRFLYENTKNIVANNGNNIAKDSLNFLGIYNAMASVQNAALYIDTAYVDRKDNYRPQYMLAVGVTEVAATEGHACTEAGKHFDANGKETTADKCVHATPGTEGYKTGRYLVTLQDSVATGFTKHPALYDGNFRLAFVEAKHIKDTLEIANSKFTVEDHSADTIKVGKDLQKATFALKIVDQATKSFVMETVDGTYVRILNGVPVLTTKIEDAAVFNIAATTEEATANEAIEAAGVQVIGGKGAVTVQGAAGKVITVANILGQTIANQVAASDNVTIAAPAGIVVVAVEGEATKVVVK